MVLFIYNQAFTLIGVIDNYTSLQWAEDYAGHGFLELVCRDTEKNIELLQQGNYVHQKGKRTAMVIRYIEKQSDLHQVTVTGYTTIDLVHQRIIFPVQTINNFEAGMYALVERFLAGSESDRNVETITTARIVNGGVSGFPYSRETQFTGTELLEALSSLSEESGLGFYMAFDPDNKRHVFTVFQGIDHTHKPGRALAIKPFAAEYGNLANITITDDMIDFVNVAYVAGAGEGIQRKHVVVGTATGIDRFEGFADRRDLQQEYVDDDGQEITLTDAEYDAILEAAGIQYLNEHVHAQSFTGIVDAKDILCALGDMVTCISSRYKVRLDTRISREEEVTENNIKTLHLTFGTPTITLL